MTAGPGRNPRRHRIEHAGAMYPALTARAAELGIVIVSQPGFLSALGDGFAAAFPGHADQLYAFGSWRRAGLTVAGSSDAPVISAAPAARHPRRGDPPHRRRPGTRAGRAAHRPGGARPVHHGGGYRDAPRRRDRLARAGQARRLRRPGRQPAAGRSRRGSPASRCWPPWWTGSPPTRPGTSFPRAEGLGPGALERTKGLPGPLSVPGSGAAVPRHRPERARTSPCVSIMAGGP